MDSFAVGSSVLFLVCCHHKSGDLIENTGAMKWPSPLTKAKHRSN